MSGRDTRKPETREELLKALTDSARKTSESEARSRPRPTRPTISGISKTLNIHRDTLYSWLKEFNVDFKEVLGQIPTYTSVEAVEDA